MLLRVPGVNEIYEDLEIPAAFFGAPSLDVYDLPARFFLSRRKYIGTCAILW